MASGISTYYWKSFTCSKTKQCLTCSLNSPTTLARLNQQIQDIWNNISQDDIHHLYGHIPVRVQVCINA